MATAKEVKAFREETGCSMAEAAAHFKEIERRAKDLEMLVAIRSSATMDFHLKKC